MSEHLNAGQAGSTHLKPHFKMKVIGMYVAIATYQALCKWNPNRHWRGCCYYPMLLTGNGRSEGGRVDYLGSHR